MSTLRPVLASLPHLPPLARLNVMPLGVAGLEARLRPLPDQLRAEVTALRARLWQGASVSLHGAAALVARQWDDIRYGFAALRARQMGWSAAAFQARHPAAPAAFAARWERSDLGRAWLGEAATMLAAGRAADLERLRLALFAKRLHRIAFARSPDELLLMATVVRWDVAERWLRSGGPDAAERLARIGQSKAHG